jgi:putative membrane protein
MKKYLPSPTLGAVAIGIAMAAWVVAEVNLGEVMHGIARVGPGGFALLCLSLIAVLGLLGTALLVSTPGEPAGRLPLFVWSRMVREAASDLLPFSQIGGLFVGARTLVGGGVTPVRAYAGMIVDITTEMLSQLLFTLFGLWMLSITLLHPATVHRLQPLLWTGAAVALATALAFVFLQQPALRLTGLIARRVLPQIQGGIEQVRDQLADFYGQRRAIALSLLFNLLAWTASAGSAWLALWLMDNPLSFGRVIALESLIFALRSVAFVIPGALGVQEAAYALLAPLFGLDPAVAVTLSLVKRGRELTLALPTLALWQFGEIRTASLARQTGP